MPLEVFAPAKVNLTLHVTGRRGDGYHLLDSLVTFADVGDVVALRAAPRLSLDLTGPEAAGLEAGADNLALRAAALFDAPAAITLDKHLPVSSGIGGGSSDAAAVLRGMAALTGAPMPGGADVLALGADVPVCLDPRPARMRGVGERLDPVPGLPDLPAVLVNPRRAVSTPDVFAALHSRDNPPMPESLPRWRGISDLAEWLTTQRNDLEAPATALVPEIAEARAALAARAGCLLARMSGSGATCFGLFPDAAGAESAADAIRAERPDWWVAACRLGAQQA